MASIAVWSKFKVFDEIAESLASLGAEALPYSSESELEALLSSRASPPDLVLDVNCHKPVKDLCAAKSLPYAVWSFDSGISLLLKRWGVRPGETYFLFNKRDFASCLEIGARAFYLPFSAARFFEIEPCRGPFACDMAVVMDSYSATASKAREGFEAELSCAGGPAAAKSLEFAKALLDYAADVQTGFLCRDVTCDAVAEVVAKSGVDLFAGRPAGLASLCAVAGQIASSRQRVALLRALASAGFKTRLYGDEAWPGLLKGCGSSVEFMGWASYESLPAIYNSAKLCLNLTQAQNIDSVPQRVFHVLAAGGCLLSNSSEPLAELFEPGRHLEDFDSFETMLSKAAALLCSPEAREALAAGGHAEFLRSHRMAGRLSKMLLEVLGSSRLGLNQEKGV